MSATVWCDGHDAPASREVWWIEGPGSRDERGRATPVCADDECLSRVLAEAGQLGELQHVTER